MRGLLFMLCAIAQLAAVFGGGCVLLMSPWLVSFQVMGPPPAAEVQLRRALAVGAILAVACVSWIVNRVLDRALRDGRAPAADGRVRTLAIVDLIAAIAVVPMAWAYDEAAEEAAARARAAANRNLAGRDIVVLRGVEPVPSRDYDIPFLIASLLAAKGILTLLLPAGSPPPETGINDPPEPPRDGA